MSDEHWEPPGQTPPSETPPSPPPGPPASPPPGPPPPGTDPTTQVPSPDAFAPEPLPETDPAPTSVMPPAPPPGRGPVATTSEPARFEPFAPAGVDAEATTKKKWPTAAKVVTAILAVVLLAVAAGLGYGWWKTNQDKNDAQEAANSSTATLNKQVTDLKGQVSTLTAQVASLNKQVSDLQGQLKSSQDATAAAQKAADDAKAQADDAKTQADALAKLFPVNAGSTAGGLPGNYATGTIKTATGSCSLAACPSTQMTLVIAGSGSSFTVSDPQIGKPALTLSNNAVWAATGQAQGALQLACQTTPVITSFTLDLAPAATALDSKGATQVTTLAGSLVLTAPASTGPSGTACPAGLAVYNVVANRT